MTEQPVMPSEVSSDDRLWVVLCFLLTPIMPIITLLMDDKKTKSFIKYHTVPTLILGVAEGILIGALTIIPFVGCISPFVWIINVIYALKANKGVNTDIPFATDFAKSQGWM